MQTVIFDFDGTIVPFDVTREFLRWQISRSLVRILLSCLLFPVIVSLMPFSMTKRLSINILNTIASVGCRQSLFSQRHAFLTHCFQVNRAPIYRDALNIIKQHQKNGQQILILSASPRWLIHGFLKQLQLQQTQLVASKQELILGVLLTTDFCYRTHKVEMAEEAGFDPSHWTAGYSDSVNDIPFLACCRSRTLVNIKQASLKELERRFGKEFSIATWK